MITSVIGGSNGHLMAEIAPLWIDGRGDVLDTTYGRGRFWTEYRPEKLYTNDLNPESPADHHFDFRYMPWCSPFGVVVFDPPYVCKGGRETSGIEEMDDRYGLRAAPGSPSEMRQLHTQGLVECTRLTRPGGILLVKIGDYISSGQYQSGLDHVTFVAAALNLEKQDLIIHHSGTGPQPGGRRQVHSRRAHTYLVVYRKPTTRSSGGATVP